MSITEAQKKTAEKYGFATWSIPDFLTHKGVSFTNLLVDEAMDLYHRSQPNL